MTLEELVSGLSLTVRSARDRLDVEVTGGYASDLLSCVMAKAQEGNIWITLQWHLNIVAVAALLQLAGIVVTEGSCPDDATLQRANEKGVPIITTSQTTFAVVAQLAALGVEGVS